MCFFLFFLQHVNGITSENTFSSEETQIKQFSDSSPRLWVSFPSDWWHQRTSRGFYFGRFENQQHHWTLAVDLFTCMWNTVRKKQKRILTILILILYFYGWTIRRCIKTTDVVESEKRKWLCFVCLTWKSPSRWETLRVFCIMFHVIFVAFKSGINYWCDMGKGF